MEELILNRKEVPAVFYTPKEEARTSHRAFGRVLAESSDHPTHGWITVGYVSRQTPFGQGTFLGFARSELREATQEEVLAAIDVDHPFGENFRPNCREALNAEFHLIMSSAIGNWTNDASGNTGSILNVSRGEIEELRDDALSKHRELMHSWQSICWEQCELIRQAFSVKAKA